MVKGLMSEKERKTITVPDKKNNTAHYRQEEVRLWIKSALLISQKQLTDKLFKCIPNAEHTDSHTICPVSRPAQEKECPQVVSTEMLYYQEVNSNSLLYILYI